MGGGHAPAGGSHATTTRMPPLHSKRTDKSNEWLNGGTGKKEGCQGVVNAPSSKVSPRTMEYGSFISRKNGWKIFSVLDALMPRPDAEETETPDSIQDVIVSGAVSVRVSALPSCTETESYSLQMR